MSTVTAPSEQDPTASPDQAQSILWVLMLLARVYEQGGLIINPQLEPSVLRTAAEAVLHELAASFRHLPADQQPIPPHDNAIQ